MRKSGPECFSCSCRRSLFDHVEKVRRHVARLDEWWAAAPVTKREAYVHDLFAPLLVDEELLGELTR